MKKTMKKIVAAVIALTMVMALMPTAFIMPGSALQGCYVEAIVSDSSNLLPISGATVQFVAGDFDESRATDGDGEFALNVPSGVEGTWTISKEGYKTLTKTVTYQYDEASEDFRLDPYVSELTKNVICSSLTDTSAYAATISSFKINGSENANVECDPEENVKLELKPSEGYAITKVSYSYKNASSVDKTVNLQEGGFLTGEATYNFLMPENKEGVVVNVTTERIKYEVVLGNDNFIGAVLDATEGCVVTHTGETEQVGLAATDAHIGDTVTLKFAAKEGYSKKIAPRFAFYNNNIDITAAITAAAGYSVTHDTEGAGDTVTFTMPANNVIVYVKYPALAVATMKVEFEQYYEAPAVNSMFTTYDKTLVSVTNPSSVVDRVFSPAGEITKAEPTDNTTGYVYAGTKKPGFYFVLGITPAGQALTDDGYIAFDMNGNGVYTDDGDKKFTKSEFTSIIDSEELFVLLGIDRKMTSLKAYVDWDGDINGEKGFDIGGTEYTIDLTNLKLKEESKIIVDAYKGTDDLFGLKSSDMIYNDVKVTADKTAKTGYYGSYAAEGSIVCVSSYPGFAGKPGTGDEGWYLPVSVKLPDGDAGSFYPDMKIAVAADKTGATVYNYTFEDDELIIVWQLNEAGKTGIIFTVDLDGAGTEFTENKFYLDLTKMVLSQPSNMIFKPSHEGILQDGMTLTIDETDHRLIKVKGNLLLNTQYAPYAVSVKVNVPSNVAPKDFENIIFKYAVGSDSFTTPLPIYNYLTSETGLALVFVVEPDTSDPTKPANAYLTFSTYFDYDAGGFAASPKTYTFDVSEVWLQQPSKGASVELLTDADVELFGKKVSDLMAYDTVNSRYVLHYTEDYTGFGNGYKGYFLPLKIKLPDTVPAKLTDYTKSIVKMVADKTGAKEFTYTFDSFDGANYMYYVFFIKDKTDYVKLNFNIDFDGTGSYYYGSDYSFTPTTDKIRLESYVQLDPTLSDKEGKTVNAAYTPDATTPVTFAAAPSFKTVDGMGYIYNYTMSGNVLAFTEKKAAYIEYPMAPVFFKCLENIGSKVVTSTLTLAYGQTSVTTKYTNTRDDVEFANNTTFTKALDVERIANYENCDYRIGVLFDAESGIYAETYYVVSLADVHPQTPSFAFVKETSKEIDLFGKTSDKLVKDYKISQGEVPETRKAVKVKADGKAIYQESYEGFAANASGYFYPMTISIDLKNVMRKQYDAFAEAVAKGEKKYEDLFKNAVIKAQGSYDDAPEFTYGFSALNDGTVDLDLVWKLTNETKTGVVLKIDWDGPDSYTLETVYNVDFTGIAFESLAEMTTVDSTVDLFGKKSTDLASDLAIAVDKTDSSKYVATGKLLYQKSYTGWGANASGYFLPVVIKNANGLKPADLAKATIKVSGDSLGAPTYTYVGSQLEENGDLVLVWKITATPNKGIRFVIDWDGEAVDDTIDANDHTGDGFFTKSYYLDTSALQLESWWELNGTLDGKLVYEERSATDKGWYYTMKIDIADDTTIDYTNLAVTVTAKAKDAKVDEKTFGYSDIASDVTLGKYLAAEWNFKDNTVDEFVISVDYDAAAGTTYYAIDDNTKDVSFTYVYHINVIVTKPAVNITYPLPPYKTVSSVELYAPDGSVFKYPTQFEIEYGVPYTIPELKYRTEMDAATFVGWGWKPETDRHDLVHATITSREYEVAYEDGAEITLEGILTNGTNLYALFDQFYSFTIDPDLQNGTITTNEEELHVGGEMIKFKAVPKDGYELSQLYYVDYANRVVYLDYEVVEGGEAYEYGFKMPTDNVFLKANFKPIENYEPNIVDTDFVIDSFAVTPIGDYNFVNVVLSVSKEDLAENDFLYLYVVVGNVGYVLNVKDMVDAEGFFKTTLMLPKDDIAYLYLVNNVNADPYSSGFTYIENALIDGTTFM